MLNLRANDEYDESNRDELFRYAGAEQRRKHGNAIDRFKRLVLLRELRLENGLHHVKSNDVDAKQRKNLRQRNLCDLRFGISSGEFSHDEQLDRRFFKFFEFEELLRFRQFRLLGEIRISLTELQRVAGDAAKTWFIFSFFVWRPSV